MCVHVICAFDGVAELACCISAGPVLDCLVRLTDSDLCSVYSVMESVYVTKKESSPRYMLSPIDSYSY